MAKAIATSAASSRFLSPNHLADIEAWILRVSSHPPDVVMSANSELPDGDNQSKKTVRRGPPRTKKRIREDSDSENNIPVISRKVTPIAPPSSTILPRTESEDEEIAAAFRDDDNTSEAPSEVNLEAISDTASDVAPSEVGSTATTVKRRNLTILRRQAMEPKEELAACIMRIKKSEVSIYKDFKEPVLETALPPQYFVFVCKR
ncbi:hypothetical protein FRC07_006539 [Ceratobasidium sp. 392]|nr:hypothetical protein FRC07_006539 [Ceratobasidium sp. 392]